MSFIIENLSKTFDSPKNFTNSLLFTENLMNKWLSYTYFLFYLHTILYSYSKVSWRKDSVVKKFLRKRNIFIEMNGILSMP